MEGANWCQDVIAFPPLPLQLGPAIHGHYIT